MRTVYVLTVWFALAASDVARPQRPASPAAPSGRGTWEQRIEIAFDKQFRGEYADAVSILAGLVKEAEAFSGGDPRLGIALNNLAFAYQDAGLYLDSERTFLRAIAVLRERSGLGDAATATPLNNLMCMYVESRQYGKAERISHRVEDALAEAKGKLEPAIVERELYAYYNNRANVYIGRRKYREASELLATGLEEAERKLGAVDSQIAALLNTSGVAKMYESKPIEAVQCFERVLKMVEKQQLDPTHPTVARALVNLAAAYAKAGRLSESDAASQRALSIFESRLGPDHPAVAAALTVRAGLLRQMKRGKEAKAMEKRAQAILARRDKDNLLNATVDASALALRPR